MPLSFTESELDEIEKSEGGGGLRRRLEEALGENRKLAGENRAFQAKELVTANSFSFVKPEDLVDVPAGKMESRAKELQEQRTKERLDLAKEMLQAQGLEGDELESRAEALVKGTSAKIEADTAEAVREAQRLDGGPAPLVDVSKLHGIDAMVHALS